MKRLYILLTLVVLLLLTATPVFAVPPHREAVNYDVVYPLFDCEPLGYENVVIMNNEVGSVRETYVFNEEDALIRFHGHVAGVDNLFNPDYPDKVASGDFTVNWSVYFDADTGDMTSEHDSGIPWNIHLPGYGNVFHVAGAAFIDENGALVRQPGLEVADFDTMCAYFAP